MPMGGGKYDEAATKAAEMTEAKGVVLIVLHGRDGSGFSARLPPEATVLLPRVLREIADQMERDLEAAAFAFERGITEGEGEAQP